jgi:hypothetical protein
VPHFDALTGTAGSFDGWMRGLPGNIAVEIEAIFEIE